MKHPKVNGIDKRDVEAHRKADAKAQQRQAEEERLVEQRRAAVTANKDAIAAMARQAIERQSVAPDKVAALRTAGVFDETTHFRAGARFPGERWIVGYAWKDGERTHSGFLGFNNDWELVTIDERAPRMLSRHRRNGTWTTLDDS